MIEKIINQISSEPSIPAEELLKDIRVLFAEDSDDVLEQFKLAVQRLGWKGLYVSNAVEIMNAVNNLLVEGLTLDAVVANISFITGPKVTGITAAREIRKAMPNVPIIFVSPYVTSMIREEVRRVEAEIVKAPFEVEALFVRMSQLIYWNRLVTANEYGGEDKRRNSVNQTKYLRRATDYILSTPERIAETLKGLNQRGNKKL